MQLRKTLTHRSLTNFEDKTFIEADVNLSIHGIECMYFICKQINAVKHLFVVDKLWKWTVYRKT